MEFKLTSPAFGHGSQIPSQYTCDSEDYSPHLVIHGVPPGTKSLALIVEDPDAPGGLWTHWVLWNIPPETREIREHTVPFGADEGVNSWGENSWGGPCPPEGTHRYIFRLYALNLKPKLPLEARREELEAAMTGHIIGTTELVGTYARTNEAPV